MMIFIVVLRKGETMSDLISTQESVAKIVDTAIRKILSGEQKLTKEYEQSVIEAVNEILNIARKERGKAEAQPEIVRCKDCNYACIDPERESDEIYCSENDFWKDDDFYCGYAERRTDEGDT